MSSGTGYYTGQRHLREHLLAQSTHAGDPARNFNGCNDAACPWHHLKLTSMDPASVAAFIQLFKIKNVLIKYHVNCELTKG